MSTVRFETSGSLGILTLANPPLNLFNLELIADLRAATLNGKLQIHRHMWCPPNS